jgi:hypothetical protein
LCLFHPRYLRSLHRVVHDAQQTVDSRRSLDVKLAWIDKIPVAHVALGRPRTEFGDAAIFVIEGFVVPSGAIAGMAENAAAYGDRIRLDYPSGPVS